MSLPDRFMAKVNQRPGGCWLWTGYTQNPGYGRVTVDGVTQYAHRYAYTMAVGPIPEGMELDHLCEVKACVNPAHLEPVTHQENIARAGGNRWGERSECKNGHPFTDARDAKGARVCRPCANERNRRYKASRKAA